MEDSFIMLKRSEKTNELMKYYPAYMVLSQIALRARRTNEPNKYNLRINEAFIGDIENIGITEKQYRLAKEKLTNWNYATFERTNRGTIATLINTDIFNVNPITEGRTKGQSEGELRATNNNYNNDNKEIYHAIIEYFNSVTSKNYRPSTGSYQKLIQAKIKEGYVLEDFKKVIDWKQKEWKGTDMYKHMCIETVFGPKFDKYLNQAPTKNINEPQPVYL